MQVQDTDISDISDQLAFIKVGLEKLADEQVKKRLSVYFESVGLRENKVFRSLNELPEWAILNLAKKIREELYGEF